MESEIEASGDLEREDMMVVEKNESTEPAAVPTDRVRHSGRVTKAPYFDGFVQDQLCKLGEGAAQS